MTVLKKVSRAVCLSENAECHNCDGAIQHFRARRQDGTAYERDRPCPYTKDANAAITALLAAAAEEGWRMCRVKATEEMDEAGLDDPKADYCDQCMQAGHTRNSGWPGVIWDAMLAASPKFEWDK